MIDRKKITPPRINLTTEAANQIRLIMQHDSTLREKCVRIHVNGKDCAGLHYALGMGEPMPADFVVKVEELAIHLDPFCAFYLPLAQVDYVILESGEDGFTVTGPSQTQYQGKFWKDNQHLIPPQESDHA